MPQLRKDPVTGRWVIVNVENPKEAGSFVNDAHEKSSKACPFCPGNESMTPPEIAAYGRKPGSKNPSEWLVRVVPNKFPALQIEEKTDKTGVGIYDKVGGFGAHEVIVETPEHDREMAELPTEQLELVLRAYRERCLDLKKDPRFKSILIFKNFGASAGASLEHPHSQLIALPVVPSRVSGEIRGSLKHYEYAERCIFCDMLHQELAEKKRTVLEDAGFIVMTPFASRFPFETWILPEAHQASFESTPDASLLPLARVLRMTLAKIKKRLNDPSFNFMIHTLPFQGKENESFHWHIEIIPQLTQVAGFELGTGFYVNPTTPELAASSLRNQDV